MKMRRNSRTKKYEGSEDGSSKGYDSRGRGSGRWTALVLSALLLVLPGCRLAREDTGAEIQSDKMIGFFVTSEPLDLFDYDRYASGHMDEFTGGGDVAIEPTAGYEERLYAVLEKTVLTGEDGSITERWEYVFPDLSGYGCYAPYMSAEVTGEPNDYWDVCSNEAFGEGSSHIDESDDGSELTMEATLYVAQTDGQENHLNQKVWCLNPVWQTADGAVYVTCGQGVSGSLSDGVRMSQTITSTNRVSQGGKTVELTDSFTVHIEGMSVPVRIEVAELDENSNLIKSGSYFPGEAPETYVPDGRAACILVTTHRRDSQGESVIRELYDDKDSGFTTFMEKEGLCVPHWTELEW